MARVESGKGKGHAVVQLLLGEAASLKIHDGYAQSEVTLFVSVTSAKSFQFDGRSFACSFISHSAAFINAFLSLNSCDAYTDENSVQIKSA